MIRTAAAAVCLVLCLAHAPARADVIEGRSACGAYRFDRSGDAAQGTFAAEVCDGAIRAIGTYRAAAHVPAQVTLRLGPRPVVLGSVRVAPFDPRAPAAVEAFASPFNAIRLAHSILAQRGGEETSAMDGLLDRAATLAGGGEACSVPNPMHPNVDREAWIRGSTYHVPAFCLVIVTGPVKVDRLRVDGMLVRLGGGLEVGTIETGSTAGALSGHVVAVGIDVARGGAGALSGAVSTLLGADVGPGTLRGVEALLRGGGVHVEGAALERIRATGGALRSSGPVRAPSVVVDSGAVSGASIEVDRLEVNGGSVKGGGYLGPVRPAMGGARKPGELVFTGGLVEGGEIEFETIAGRAGAVSGAAVLAKRITVEGGGRVEGKRSLRATTVIARNGAVSGGEAELEEITATDRSSVRGGAYLGPAKEFAVKRGTAHVTDSSVGADGELKLAFVTARNGGVVASVIDVQELVGDGTGVRAGRLLRARTGKGLVKLTGGRLDAVGSPVEGEPGLAGCARHAPQIDAIRLETSGTPAQATHVRLDEWVMRGGKMWLSNDDSIAACWEVARSTDVDGDAAVPFLVAPRLYARLGDARVGPSTAIEITPSGDRFLAGTREYHGETKEIASGASFGGFGGTSGDLNGNVFDPAERPGARPELGKVESPLDFRESGLGGRGKKGGTGGGVVRLVARTLAFDGRATAPGTDAEAGAGGGSGGTMFVDVEGAISGKGLLQVNGGKGGFGRGAGPRTGGGGSGGRIRISCADRAGWTGRTETLGGLGGDIGNAEEGVAAWDDRRNHGGPGTVFWDLPRGADEIVIEGTLDGGELRGVGYLNGEFPDAKVTIRKAIVATDGLTARALALEAGAVLVPNDSRVRLDFPVRAGKYRSKGKGLALSSAQTIYPVDVWADLLDEKLAISLSGDLTIDATSRLDASGLGGPYQSRPAWRDAFMDLSGGSHGGYGGQGRSGSPQNLGKPPPVRGSPLEPTDVGAGGLGLGSFDPRKPVKLIILGGVGGGALRLRVGGTARVEGKILADGAPGTPLFQDYEPQGTGGGAGGSVWLSARALAGAGLVSASGGEGSAHPYYNAYGGGGGGGRIRIDADDRSGWTGKVLALGARGARASGEKAWSDLRTQGGAGTIFWNVKGEIPTVVVDNAGAEGGVAVVSGSFPTHRILVSAANVVTSGLAAKALVLHEGALLAGDDQRFWLHQLPAASHPWLSLYLWTEPRPSAIRISAGELDVGARSRIDVSGLGAFGAMDEQCSRGAFANPAGGSHGGTGGRGRAGRPKDVGCPSKTRGDAARPTTLGEGGFGGKPVAGWGGLEPCLAGGSGGGALELVIAGKAAVDGVVAADGAGGASEEHCKDPQGTGGGAGGSVWLVAAELGGKGIVRASGGRGSSSRGSSAPYGGGGGGGRVALDVRQCRFEGAVKVDGGPGGSGPGVAPEEFAGSPGSVSGCNGRFTPSPR